jgi:class 3 adenylate cyclase
MAKEVLKPAFSFMGSHLFDQHICGLTMRPGTITVNPDSPDKYLVQLEEGEVLSIGRKPALDKRRKLVLPYPEVSGQHAEIRAKPDGWTIIDSGSTNGTNVNGMRLTPGREYTLKSGDRVSIAQYELLIALPIELAGHENEEAESQDQTQFRIHLINATILVADIKGFTGLMEQYASDPSFVMQAAQQVFQIMNEEIHNNYGQLEKIAGDAIMAYWPGDDSKSGVQAYQACLTALRLKALASRLANSQEHWPFQNYPLMLDMALATGPVATGALGHSNTNPALLGDTANLVFRLEKLIGDDRPGDIVVEGMTYDLVKDHFNFQALGQFNVKGRQRAVDVYRLVGLNH